MPYNLRKSIAMLATNPRRQWTAQGLLMQAVRTQTLSMLGTPQILRPGPKQ